MSSKVCIALLLLLSSTFCSARLTEFVKWQNINYRNLPISNDPNFYNASVIIPFGVAHFNGRVFIGVPRRNPGIPSTLNVIELNGNPPHLNPSLMSYPSWDMNTLNAGNRGSAQKIVSVYRPRVDVCGRLWFVDTGVLEYRNNNIVVQRPSVWTVDLNTNSLIARFEIPENLAATARGLASITVDALDQSDCTNTFAYIPDLVGNAILVYSLRSQRMWQFNHNYFRMNPFEGDFNVDGVQFQWDDGVFSIALSRKKPNGFRTAFFHPLASYGEFTVSTEVLRNEELSRRQVHGNDFKFIGSRGANSGNHFLDVNTNVMFYAEMQNNAVSCWHVRADGIKRVNMGIVQQNNSTLIYPVDLEIDNDNTLWVLSNRLPRFIYARYDTNAYNFNLWREKVVDALSDTKCLDV